MPILWTLHRSQWKIGIYFYKNKIKLSYPIQKLRENNVEEIDIMQISGHKNVAFINNYSTTAP
jgi:hypothetical protein